MSKVNKTQQKVQAYFDLHKRYALMARSTGIDNKRLAEIRKGSKASRSEVGKISAFKIPNNKKKPGQEVTLDDIKKSTGMSKDEIKHALSSGNAKVTKKYLDKDNTYLLKTKQDANYLLMMVIHVNLQTADVGIGLSKKFEYKILGDTGTRYEDFMGPSGKRYSFTITVFRLHQYSNLKAKIEMQVKKILAARDHEIESSEIDTLLDLVGYA